MSRSLATLLWRRLLRERDADPPVGEFLRLGALTVPAALALVPADAEVTLVHVAPGEVVEAAQDADLLVAAHDGDRSRLGPASLGPVTRFVVDHAPARSCWSGPSRPRRSGRCRRDRGG